MRKSLIWAAMTALSTTACFPATLFEDPRTIPALILLGNATGSGCFLRLSNSVYLVTAKHVLFAAPVNTNPPALISPLAVVKTFSRVGTTNVSERAFAFNLTQLLGNGDIRSSPDRDVALVRVEQCNSNDLNVVQFLPGFAPLTPNTGLGVNPPGFVCRMNEVDVGSDVYMFGYPTSLTAPNEALFDPFQPLIRKGIVAGINSSKRTIIIDCPAYYGNSGGPVIQAEHSGVGIQYRMIGLVSKFVPFQELWENKTMGYSHVLLSNSGYTILEPIDIALELVWK